MAHVVGLCGIDGSGKTTVAGLVVDALRRANLRVRYHHELDFPVTKALLRFTGRLAGARRVDRLKNEVITNKENNQPVVSVLYHLLVWAESLALYLWFKMTPGLVIHDRWPYDFLLQFRHRRYGNRLIYKLFSAFPSPDTLVWLRVEPAIAYQRKRTDPGHLEDGLDYFENLDAWMIEFASHRAYDAVICADASADIVAADLERVIRGRMTDRGGA